MVNPAADLYNSQLRHALNGRQRRLSVAHLVREGCERNNCLNFRGEGFHTFIHSRCFATQQENPLCRVLIRLFLGLVCVLPVANVVEQRPKFDKLAVIMGRWSCAFFLV